MHNTKYEKARVIRFLLWAFVPAYLIQIGAAALYNSGKQPAAQLIMMAMMYVPALAVLLAGGNAAGLGWKPQIRKNFKTILAAWFGPIILTIAGGLLYFLVFPGHFDLSGGYLTELGGAQALDQIKAQGISLPVYVLIGFAGMITYAPLINMLVALGEEIGWRGFLYPQLKAKYGSAKGQILGGVIWGAWHWPLIWLIGYEYGAASGNAAGYWGFPVSGMLAFCVIAAGLGILHDWLYEQSGSIWLPSLFHGAFNAAASLPLMLCLANTGTARLLGPAPNGLLAGIPILIAAGMILRKEKKQEEES